MKLPDLNAPIGVFDSGIGGLSVLRALRAALPLERFVYFADSAHAPYGEKGDAFVLERSIAISQQLMRDHAVKALVVACNTATAAAIARLRELHPNLIIIGIEPALKPAAANSMNKQVAVLATRGTLGSEKFKALLNTQSQLAHFTCQPCDGLAEAIENHLDDLNAPVIHELIKRNLQLVGLNNKFPSIDTLVLGCTHYPLVKPVFQSYLPASVTIIDNGAGVAKRLTSRLKDEALLQNDERSKGGVQFSSSAAKPQNWTAVLNA